MPGAVRDETPIESPESAVPESAAPAPADVIVAVVQELLEFGGYDAVVPESFGELTLPHVTVGFSAAPAGDAIGTAVSSAPALTARTSARVRTEIFIVFFPLWVKSNGRNQWFPRHRLPCATQVTALPSLRYTKVLAVENDVPPDVANLAKPNVLDLAPRHAVHVIGQGLGSQDVRRR